jgi:hypothetical protein
MGAKTFQVIYQGETVPGASIEKVKANVAKLFKAPAAKVEPLFSGKRIVIKKNLDETTARKYQMALKRAGALVRIVATPTSAPQPRKPAPRPQAPSAARPAPPTPSGRRAPAGAGALEGATLDKPGVVLVEPERVEEPVIDISHLSMDKPGATLVEPEKVSPPQVNTDGLSLDEPGVTLVEPDKTPPLQVDISGLSMDRPGVTLVESKPVPVPEIDTSSLSLKK